MTDMEIFLEVATEREKRMLALYVIAYLKKIQEQEKQEYKEGKQPDTAENAGRQTKDADNRRWKEMGGR